jgi:exonuclease VII large subunit
MVQITHRLFCLGALKAMMANTVGVIAKKTEASRDQVLYVIRSRRIEPTMRAGHFRIFSEEAVSEIRAEIERIRARQPLRRIVTV